jgi:hypothetical protein
MDDIVDLFRRGLGVPTPSSTLFYADPRVPAAERARSFLRIPYRSLK